MVQDLEYLQCNFTSKTTENWLHGHWVGLRGATHYNDNLKSSGTNSSPDNWVCAIEKNSGTTPHNILIDGVWII